jgi:hypothetical protein
MRIRWTQTENTPLRYVEAGTIADTDDELAKQLIAAGIAEPVVEKAERAVRPKASTAVKK